MPVNKLRENFIKATLTITTIYMLLVLADTERAFEMVSENEWEL